MCGRRAPARTGPASKDVGAVTARERPDVALVRLAESSEHALHMVERIVHEAACPVIVLIHTPDPAFVKEASKRGVFAYITDADARDWQSSIDIVLRQTAKSAMRRQRKSPAVRGFFEAL
jgi:AmiR/NasT family two-component response regulator